MNVELSPDDALDPGIGLTEQRLTLPDGRRIRAVSAGRAPGPLVVFEAGMSAPAASWIHTQREISAHARTLSYDRAGYGGSDVDPQDRTIERIVDDLTAVLDTLGETAPVILVGHSWGGPIQRCFADRHPERVAGLVFVDSSVAEVMSPGTVKLSQSLFRVLSVLARVGGKSLIFRANLPHGASAEISEADLAIVKRDFACAQAMRAGSRESAQLIPALPLMRRLQTTPLPDVPTTFLQGGRIDRSSAKFRATWNKTAKELMAHTPKGKFIVVEEAGHLIPQEAPTPVREAILDVLNTARNLSHPGGK